VAKMGVLDAKALSWCQPWVHVQSHLVGPQEVVETAFVGVVGMVHLAAAEGHYFR